jgi:hypothetical protein
MKIDSQKHNRRSMRLEGNDYTLPGMDFITLVTHKRECLFGEVLDGEIRMNRYGKIIERVWMDLPLHYL